MAPAFGRRRRFGNTYLLRFIKDVTERLNVVVKRRSVNHIWPAIEDGQTTHKWPVGHLRQYLDFGGPLA